MNDILKNMEPLFSDMMNRLNKFKKATYEEAFSLYREQNSAFFEELNVMLAAEGENAGFFEEFIDVLISYVSGVIEQTQGKIKKENLQINFNMFMAVYFMPMILDGRQVHAKELTEEICQKWSKQFKESNIKAASYEDIASGFKSKLCYVTTAVCKSLNKPDDCYELELLRDYRDHCLMETKQGEELVRKYYDIAPTIVKRIDKCEDAQAKYLYIWENYLKPCIKFIENGEKDACGETYVQMVEELQSQYIITAKDRKN